MSKASTNTVTDGAAVVDEQIKFVWLDEDGNQCSPVHAKFRSALDFISTWDTRTERIARNDDGGAKYRLPQPHSKTGKPPVKLQRLVIRTYTEDITEAQAEIL